MNKQTLINDINNMEDVLDQTVNTLEYRYTYYIALAVWHILQWIVKKR